MREGGGHCWSSSQKPCKVFGKATARSPARLFRLQIGTKGHAQILVIQSAINE